MYTAGYTAGTIQTSNALEGIRGWLRFFVIIRIYLDPIVTTITLILAWVGFTSLAKEHPGVIVAGLIDTAMSIYLTVRGILIGRWLRARTPRVVQITKKWLLLVLAWSIISPCLALLLGFPAALLLPEVMKGFVKSLISFAIWYSYFTISKRVHATYPDWAGNGQHFPDLASADHPRASHVGTLPLDTATDDSAVSQVVSSLGSQDYAFTEEQRKREEAEAALHRAEQERQQKVQDDEERRRVQEERIQKVRQENTRGVLIVLWGAWLLFGLICVLWLLI
jgi:hypothetical protein